MQRVLNFLCAMQFNSIILIDVQSWIKFSEISVSICKANGGIYMAESEKGNNIIHIIRRNLI